MSKAKSTRKTLADNDTRGARIQALKDRLAQWEADTDQAVIAMYLARFDGYSPRNAMMIAMQCPTATDVDGYATWQTRGRQVRAGADSIVIWRPIARKGEGDEPEPEPGELTTKRGPGMIPGYLFDVTQTDEARCFACGAHMAKDGFGRFAPWLAFGDETKEVRGKCPESESGKHYTRRPDAGS